MTDKRKTVSLRMAFSMSSCSNVKPRYEGFIVEINGRDWTINTMMLGETALALLAVMNLKSKKDILVRNRLGSVVLIIAHNASFDRRFLEFSAAILGCRDVTCHALSQRSWLRSKDLVEAPKIVPDMGNDLGVDADWVGDLGEALDIVPQGAPVAAEARSRLRTGWRKGKPRRWCGGSVGLAMRPRGKWLGTALIS
jgi:hypothetical protein